MILKIKALENIKQIKIMEWKVFTKRLNELLEQNEFKKVFEFLKKTLLPECSRNQILIQISRQYNSLLDTKMLDTLEFEEFTRNENKIGGNLGSLISSLNQSDFIPNPNKMLDEIIYENDDITNPILILTQSEKMQNIKAFFQQLNFRNVETKEYSNKEYSVNDYDLIIFDNQDLPYCNPEKMFHSMDEKNQILVKDRIRNMEYVKNNGSKSIIHFGEFLFWVGANRDIVQAANSKFTLHARAKEMIEFINTYRV